MTPHRLPSKCSRPPAALPASPGAVPEDGAALAENVRHLNAVLDVLRERSGEDGILREVVQTEVAEFTRLMLIFLRRSAERGPATRAA